MKNGFAHIFVLLLLIVGLIVTVYLVGQRTNFFPKAEMLFVSSLKQGEMNPLLAEERRVAGINERGKITISRAEDLAEIAPKAYQDLVRKGLIESPGNIKKIGPLGGGGTPPPRVTPTPGPSLPPNISSCGNITESGNYLLTQDIVSEGRCINIHNTQNVNLDCQNYTIASNDDIALDIQNVQNFSVKNCTIRSIYPNSSGGPGQSLLILDSSSGSIQNNNILRGYIDVRNGDHLQITGNTFHTFYQQFDSSFNQISNNNFIGDPNYFSAGVLISGYGDHNTMINNILDGQWDGVRPSNIEDYKGADDGLILSWETEDTVSGNTINNNWDCGIETLGFIQNTRFTNNRINNSGLCGIGGWYWHSWLGNVVDSNIITRAAYLFYMFRYNGLDEGEQRAYFKDNNFSNNVFLQQTDSSLLGPTSDYSSLIDFQYSVYPIPPSAVEVGNIIFNNNDFGQTTGSPIIIPVGMVLDQGNNKCSMRDDPSRPLNCISVTPTLAPTLTPTTRPRVCIQVITLARNPQTRQCQAFRTPCDVPVGWESCTMEDFPTPTPTSMPIPTSTLTPTVIPTPAVIASICRDVALNKKVVSSGYYGGNSPEKVVDGDESTAGWSTNQSTGAWMYIDLESPQSINQIKTLWGWDERFGNTAISRIDVSNDAQNWSTVSTSQLAKGDRTKKTINFNSTNARYVRFYAQEWNGGWGYVNSLEVYPSNCSAMLR